VVAGEPEDLEVCKESGCLATPAHQQAYLRNVGGKRSTKYDEETISSPKSKTLLDYDEII
jgi:hypothetical protein